MKKVYKTYKYKSWHDRRSKKILFKGKRNKEYNKKSSPIYENTKHEYINGNIVKVPSDICIFSESNQSILFFNNLRKEKNIFKIKNYCFIQVDLSEVINFDYSSVCVLGAIIEDLKAKNVYTRAILPEDRVCRNKIIDSGILSFMLDKNGRKFKKNPRTDLLLIKKGSKKITRADNVRIVQLLKNSSRHLIGKDILIKNLRLIIVEICGNSIEWGKTRKKQWLLGVKYEKNSVIFTVTDVGVGILSSLNRKFKDKMSDFFSIRTDYEILKRAFERKYQSKSGKTNRNRGLPSIKNGHDIGLIKNLKVFTNNVILDFPNNFAKSKTLENVNFKGTLYQWEIQKENIIKFNGNNN